MAVPVKYKSNQQGSDLADSLKIDINRVVANLQPSSWKKRSIYRVPYCLKGQANNNAYIPRVVSLGPYHYDDLQVQGMNLHKLRALDCMLRRNRQDITMYVNAINELEQEARACYDDLPEKFTSDVFVKMLLLDGCFVLEILSALEQGSFKELGYVEDDPFFSSSKNSYMIDGVMMDLLLLENQIPLFILNRIYQLQSQHQDDQSVIKLVLNVLNPGKLMLGWNPTVEEENELKRSILVQGHVNLQNVLHIFWESLHNGRKHPRPTSKKPVDPETFIIPSVTALKEAGVEFVKQKKTLRFWDIKFENGILAIPQIVIADESESIFLNLIAFEQCHVRSSDARILPYIYFMDNLVNSSSDVAELRDNGIIVHTLGSDEEVSNLFNRLVKGAIFSVENGYLVELYEHVNEYQHQTCNRWRANLCHNYFSTPWSVIAVIAASIGLILTATSTFCDVRDLVKGKDK